MTSRRLTCHLVALFACILISVVVPGTSTTHAMGLKGTPLAACTNQSNSTSTHIAPDRVGKIKEYQVPHGGA